MKEEDKNMKTAREKITEQENREQRSNIWLISILERNKTNGVEGIIK